MDIKPPDKDLNLGGDGQHIFYDPIALEILKEIREMEQLEEKELTKYF